MSAAFDELGEREAAGGTCRSAMLLPHPSRATGDTDSKHQPEPLVGNHVWYHEGAGQWIRCLLLPF